MLSRGMGVAALVYGNVWLLGFRRKLRRVSEGGSGGGICPSKNVSLDFFSVENSGETSLENPLILCSWHRNSL